MLGVYAAKVSGTGDYSGSLQRHKEEIEQDNEEVFHRKTNNDGMLNASFNISAFLLSFEKV